MFRANDSNERMLIVRVDFDSSVFFSTVLYWFIGQECQANGTEYVPIGRKKKKQKPATDEDDDEQYVDLSDDEIVIEDDDDDDDLSDLYPGKSPSRAFFL